MNKIKVIVDSTVDMSLEELNKLDVDMLPLYVSIHGEEYLDYQEIKWDQVIAKVEQYNELPKTSAINIERFTQAFEKYLSQGYDVIFLSLGSEFSSNYSNAVLTAQLLDNKGIYVIDSRNLSSAIGLQVLKICKMRDEGLSAQEIVDNMKDIIENTQTETALETVEYLHKGGRCSGVARFFSSILRLYPIVKIKEGIIKVHKIGKLKFKNALDKIVQDFKHDLDENNVDEDHIIISTVGNKKAQMYLYDQVSQFYDPKKILLFDAGCVVSTHCGPGTTGFFYIRKRKVA